MQVMDRAIPMIGASDTVIWNPELKVGYSVKSGYGVLEELRVVEDVEAALKEAFTNVWKTCTPLKLEHLCGGVFLIRSRRRTNSLEEEFFILPTT